MRFSDYGIPGVRTLAAPAEDGSRPTDREENGEEESSSRPDYGLSPVSMEKSAVGYATQVRV